MGHQVRALVGAACLALMVNQAAAQTPPDSPRPAASIDVFTSNDADHTSVQKYGANLDWRYAGPDEFQGLRLETARFRPQGLSTTTDQRVYLRLTDKGVRWSWKGQAGTDGRTVLGSLNLHNEAKFRQEYFLEREILETPRGLSEGVYYTFGGGALDLPINDRNNFTVVAGLQEFTGKNLRSHVRVNYVHVLQPEWGLTAQVRTRYFHSSTPGEYDYFSPRWYAEVTPVVQLRRRAAGWRYVLAAGLGAQRNAGSGWRSARFFNAQLTSPPVGQAWAVTGAFTYSDTPVAVGFTYDYQQATLGITRVF